MVIRSPHGDVGVPESALVDFVLRRANELDDKPALKDGPTGRTITYAQLKGGVDRVATGLAQRGFAKGDVFAIFLPNLPEYAVAFHGVARTGGVNTTVNPLYSPSEVSFQLRDSNARFLLTIPQFLDRAIEGTRGTRIEEIFVLGEAEGATPFAELEAPGEPPSVEIGPSEDVVVLPYSSGTTGFPKGVMLTHRNLVANICQIASGQLISEDEIILGVLPFFHIYGMNVVMNHALYQGATVVTMPKFDLEDFLAIMQDEGVTRAYLVPPIILGLAKHAIVDNYDLGALTRIMSGAAPLSGDLAEACGQRLGCLVAQGYGLTETSPVTHMVPDAGGHNKPGSIGPLVAGTEARVVDISSGRDLGAGERGEIWIRGPQVMNGYLNNPKATSITIDPDGWLHSGDIGYADEDDYFYIVDRVKELIKYKGYQVPPAELEAMLLSYPAVTDAAVVGRPDEEAGEIPVAYVVLKGDATADEIMTFVAERVSPQKKVRDVRIVDEIPKSASGKILRRVLKDRERDVGSA